MTLLSCSCSVVELPSGRMGNSEVGHPHIGTGRYVPQDFSKVNGARFSGGVDTVFSEEDGILVPSPKIRIYDLQPKMNSGELAAIIGGKFDAIVCNYANCDMLGHSGIMDAAILAVEAVYASLQRVVDALKPVGRIVRAMLGAKRPVEMTDRSLIKFV
ncbi:MAG: hypothetical protein ACXV8O_07385 [Methylobacter sp.]